MTSYRYPGEHAIFFLTLGVVSFVFLLTAGLSVCILPLLLVFVIFYSYQSNLAHHQMLLQKALQIDPQKSPGVIRLIRDCARKVKPGKIQVYLYPSNTMNAYTFGFSDPKGLVIFSRLFKEMEEKELSFVVGHEMGHAALGHVWVNTLIGGMAGFPQSLGLMFIFSLVFRWWNRACEFSADRAGLLACGDLNKATTALVKLAFEEADTPEEIRQALQMLDTEDDSFGNNLVELFSTHPMIIRRIHNLKDYSGTAQYRRLQEQVNQAAEIPD